MKIFFFSLQVLLLLSFLVSCTFSQRTELYYNKSFDEISHIAYEKNKNFCVVLLDSTQRASQSYQQRLENKKLEKNVIYNLAYLNHSINEWYEKWLCPIYLPTTCVFSSNGTLIDLIPGGTKEAFLYTAKALDETITTQYHYANHFKIDKSTLIPLLDKVLKSKIDLEHGVYSGLIDSIVNTLHYPYVYYIKMIGEMINNDSTNALSTAKDMIRLETPSYLELYKSEFITAKKIINPNFNIADEPTIRVNEDVITLSDVKNGGERPFNITIHNDGEQQLKISNIIKSCSCLELDSINSSFIVPPKDSIQINFIFRAEQQGEIIRDIFIASNGINKPILYIQVLANVM